MNWEEILLAAQQKGEENIVAQRVDVNEKDQCGDTLLHAACKHGMFDVVKILVDRNADINLRNNDGLSAIYLSVIGMEKLASEGCEEEGLSKYKATIQFLKTKGADYANYFGPLTDSGLAENEPLSREYLGHTPLFFVKSELVVSILNEILGSVKEIPQEHRTGNKVLNHTNHSQQDVPSTSTSTIKSLDIIHENPKAEYDPNHRNAISLYGPEHKANLKS